MYHEMGLLIEINVTLLPRMVLTPILPVSASSKFKTLSSNPSTTKKLKVKNKNFDKYSFLAGSRNEIILEKQPHIKKFLLPFGNLLENLFKVHLS
jgi:hypothetical protein